MSCQLVITDPARLDATTLQDTDVPETDYAAYSSGATYSLGDRVVDGGAVWESAQNANTGHTPGAANVAWWLHVGATNRWAAFDERPETATAKSGGFYYEFIPDKPVTAVHFLDLVGCNSIRVRLTDSVEGEVFDSGAVPVGVMLAAPNWWEWCFGERVLRDTLHIYGIPPYRGATLRIDVDGISMCAIGTIVAGQSRAFGKGVEYGVRLGIDDYSRKGVDDWGVTALKPGRYSEQISVPLLLMNGELDSFADFMKRNRARALMWNVSDRWRSTQVFGFYRNWSLLIAYARYANVSIDIEGMSKL